ncbi:DUF4097 family beta strand repeat-containing protein [Streptomyces sp. UG1]|uniref:DUF4097 family beta strand repeat-containing protein n=1 Tax=Streptomyces sp. UG1 TaxID=3417652 RepID=UPI003CE6BDC5
MPTTQYPTRTFDTPAPITTVLDVPAGHIRLIAADRPDTTVEILPADPARSRDVKAAGQIETGYADGVLRITAPANNRYAGPCGTVEITVQLPAGSRIEGKQAAGGLRGVGRLGDVTLETAQGPVRLDETATARLTTRDGDITIGRLTGPAQLTTQRGDIRITEATTGTLTLHTQHGHISAGAARAVSATLNAHTGYGRIHNTLNNTHGPTAALTIHATTHHGDITAHSL